MFLKLMVILSVLTSLLLSQVLSPFIMCLFVVMLTTWSCGLVSLLSSLWMSYALALVFLGGMMVLFTYSSSMSVSDKFTGRGSWEVMSVTGLLFFGLVTGLDLKVFMGGLYVGVGAIFLLISTLYLLSCLFLCVKLVEVNKGALLV